MFCHVSTVVTAALALQVVHWLTSESTQSYSIQPGRQVASKPNLAGSKKFQTNSNNSRNSNFRLLSFAYFLVDWLSQKALASYGSCYFYLLFLPFCSRRYSPSADKFRKNEDSSYDVMYMCFHVSLSLREFLQGFGRYFLTGIPLILYLKSNVFRCLLIKRALWFCAFGFLRAQLDTQVKLQTQEFSTFKNLIT